MPRGEQDPFLSGREILMKMKFLNNFLSWSLGGEVGLRQFCCYSRMQIE